MAEVKEYDLRLKSPFTAIVSGPTGAGKTQLVSKLIENALDVCVNPPIQIFYCFGANQEKFSELQANSSIPIEFTEGLIDIESRVPSDNQHRWIVVDDLMEEVTKKPEMRALFTKHSHHKKLSVFFIVQNLHHSGIREISLNSQYMFVFKSPRDLAQIGYIGRQMAPSNSQIVTRSYADATRTPFNFLLLDFTQETPEEIRVLGNFLSDDDVNRPLTVYKL